MTYNPPIEKESKQEQLLQKDKQEELRRSRIERLLSGLSWKSERDAARALADTSSSKQRRGCKKQNPPFQPVYSYTTDALLKDMRFKVNNFVRHLNLLAVRFMKHWSALVFTRADMHRKPSLQLPS